MQPKFIDSTQGEAKEYSQVLAAELSISTTPERLVSASKVSVAKWYDSNGARKDLLKADYS